MREARLAPIGSNTFAVRVDSYENGEVKGEFLAPGTNAAVKFSSLPGLILLIEHLLDVDEGARNRKARPPSTTFDPNVELEVLFRQNHSWQGRIRLLDDGREAAFRSVLELLIIMQAVYGD